MDQIWPYAAALLPSIGVGYLFYVIIRNVLEGDRNERVAQARWEREQERAAGAQRPDNGPISGPAGESREKFDAEG